jgi:hypothetical protein
MTRGKDLQISGLQKKISRRFPPFTWSVCKKEEEGKREKHGLGSSWPKLKFEFESFKLGLKVELG